MAADGGLEQTVGGLVQHARDVDQALAQVRAREATDQTTLWDEIKAVRAEVRNLRTQVWYVLAAVVLGPSAATWLAKLVGG